MRVPRLRTLERIAPGGTTELGWKADVSPTPLAQPRAVNCVSFYKKNGNVVPPALSPDKMILAFQGSVDIPLILNVVLCIWPSMSTFRESRESLLRQLPGPIVGSCACPANWVDV